LEILLRAQLGMAFHIQTIIFKVVAKELIVWWPKLGKTDFGKKLIFTNGIFVITWLKMVI